jgi:hypothetical protein
VMPVVNDDEVLGVFELFSGKANAFGARDVSAVQRLSEMVETAVRLAQATERLPEQLKIQPSAEVHEVTAREGQVLEEQVLEHEVLDGEVLEDIVLEDPILEPPDLEEQAPVVPAAAAENQVAAAPEPLKAESPAAAEPMAEIAPAKKTLFWSAALNPASDAARPDDADQSHVPPVLRSLRKCEACGFPVSAGRVLCVECEEKKWRGQLRVPKSAPRPASAPAPTPTVSTAPVPKPEVRAFAAAAQSVAAVTPIPSTQRTSAPAAVSAGAVAASPAVKESKAGAAQPVPVPALSNTPVVEKAAQPAEPTSGVPEFVLSAGLAPSQSWLARNKYILGVLLVAGIAVVAVFLLR